MSQICCCRDKSVGFILILEIKLVKDWNRSENHTSNILMVYEESLPLFPCLLSKGDEIVTDFCAFRKIIEIRNK